MKVKNDFAMSIQPLISRYLVPMRRCSRPAAGGVPKAAISADLKRLGYAD
jgi:hypothetical protein